MARVVPAVPSFSVDDGFRYLVPDHLPVTLGSLVRVPLGGRRVRGFVVSVEEMADVGGFRPVVAVSGHQPVFHDALLESLRWAAQHYVSPVASVLERAAPPSNPRAAPSVSRPTSVPTVGALDRVVEAGLSGRVSRPTVLLGTAPWDLVAGTAGALLVEGRSTLVVTATTIEAEAVFERLSAALPGHAVIAHGDMPAAAVTGAWTRATAPVVVVGTPRVAAWPVARPGAVFVVEDGRRAMKDRQTPTIHARDLLRRRSQLERFALVVTGPTPTIETMATGPSIVRPRAGRLWPLVEVVDRRVDLGAGLLTDTARRAVAAVHRNGGRIFVFGHRRGYAAATRCVACRTVRRCPGCGSRPDPGDVCIRCGTPLGPCGDCGGTRFEPLGAGVGRLVADVGRIVGAGDIAPAPSEAPVVVGTERDILGIADLDLVVVPDFDGLLLGTDFRAAEDSLRLGARLASLLGRRSGTRMIVQTSEPTHAVLQALAKGDPLPALESELEQRRANGYPPAGEILVLETTGAIVPDLAPLAELCDVLGPATRGDAKRWLLQAKDLRRTKRALRPLVQQWRDGGLRVRVDVDPIDL